MKILETQSTPFLVTLKFQFDSAKEYKRFLSYVRAFPNSLSPRKGVRPNMTPRSIGPYKGMRDFLLDAANRKGGITYHDAYHAAAKLNPEVPKGSISGGLSTLAKEGLLKVIGKDARGLTLYSTLTVLERG